MHAFSHNSSFESYLYPSELFKILYYMHSLAPQAHPTFNLKIKKIRYPLFS